jgi:hypothetical protein
MKISVENTHDIPEITDSPIHMTVDAEHIGIRTAMPILAIVGLIGGFILGGIIAPLIDDAFSTMCMSLIGAIAGLVILTQIGERVVASHQREGQESGRPANRTGLYRRLASVTEAGRCRPHSHRNARACYPAAVDPTCDYLHDACDGSNGA